MVLSKVWATSLTPLAASFTETAAWLTAVIFTAQSAAELVATGTSTLAKTFQLGHGDVETGHSGSLLGQSRLSIPGFERGDGRCGGGFPVGMKQSPAMMRAQQNTNGERGHQAADGADETEKRMPSIAAQKGAAVFLVRIIFAVFVTVASERERLVIGE